MSRITWDAIGERLYEVGLDHGVLYLPYMDDYINGVPWNGLTSVSSEQSGRSASGLYEGGVRTGNVYTPEELGGTIKAYTYPEEFEQFFGEEEIMPGILIPHQDRALFGFSYRTLKGNDVDGSNLGYKIHLVYNAEITEASRTYSTINETLDVEPMEWKYACYPVPFDYERSVSEIVFDSTRHDPVIMQRLEEILYGTDETMARLPTFDEIQSYFFQGLYPSDITYPRTVRYKRGLWMMGRTVTANGRYSAEADDVDGYSSVLVRVRPDFTIVDALPPVGESDVFYYMYEEGVFNEYMYIDDEWVLTGEKDLPVSAYSHYVTYELTDAEIHEIVNS